MQSDKKSVMDKIGKVYNVFSKKINPELFTEQYLN